MFRQSETEPHGDAHVQDDDAAVKGRLPQKPHHFHILLGVDAGPAHGYGMRREIEERTGGVLRAETARLEADVKAARIRLAASS